MIVSGILIREVLGNFGNFAWEHHSCIDSNDLEFNENSGFRFKPHYTAWRYKNPDPEVEQAITEAVNSFKGNVEWIIDVKPFGNRNWIIETKKASEYRKEGKVDKKWHSVENYLAEHEPEFGLTANLDIPALAEHIDKYVRNKLGEDRFKK